MEWQPIETAPRDGRYVMLWWRGDDNGFTVGMWNGKSWDDGNFYDNMGSDGDFSHWMIPTPPSA